MKLILKKNADWSKYGFQDRYSHILCKTGHAKMLRVPDTESSPIIVLYDLGRGKYKCYDSDFNQSAETKKVLEKMIKDGNAKFIDDKDCF